MTGQELRRWRESHGLTLQQLGDLVGVELNTVWRWEKGERSPNKFTRPLLEKAIARIERRRGKGLAA